MYRLMYNKKLDRFGRFAPLGKKLKQPCSSPHMLCASYLVLPYAGLLSSCHQACARRGQSARLLSLPFSSFCSLRAGHSNCRCCATRSPRTYLSPQRSSHGYLLFVFAKHLGYLQLALVSSACLNISAPAANRCSTDSGDKETSAVEGGSTGLCIPSIVRIRFPTSSWLLPSASGDCASPTLKQLSTFPAEGVASDDLFSSASSSAATSAGISLEIHGGAKSEEESK
mmetsp:Transcript_46052/g.99421  ORF Transcript_46052/g.99421 Transcript_46052/m.99421 type:complete len:227 (-) Transcript_46052:46-726(-)